MFNKKVLAQLISCGFRLSELGSASAEFSLVRDGTSYQAKLQTVNNQPISFGTNSVTRMVIDTVGNVGIGSPHNIVALHEIEHAS